MSGFFLYGGGAGKYSALPPGTNPKWSPVASQEVTEYRISTLRGRRVHCHHNNALRA